MVCKKLPPEKVTFRNSAVKESGLSLQLLMFIKKYPP